MAHVHHDTTGRRGLGRPASTALLVAALWSSCLVIAGFLLPAYSSESVSSSGAVSHASRTLVEVEGPSVLFVLAVPLVVTVVVGSTLLARPQAWALPASWALVLVLAGFTLLSLASIGLFVVPVVGALAFACATSAVRPGLR